MTDRVEMMARRIAGFTVGVVAESESSDFEPDGSEWPQLLERLEQGRLTGLATTAKDHGALSLTAEQEDDLDERHATAMCASLRVEQALLELWDEFVVDGVQPIVLKGPSIAHTIYPDPAMRPFVDLDLLVPASNWQQACRFLELMGLTRRLPEPRRGFDERFGKAAVFVRSDGLQVDLHRSLVAGPLGLGIEADRFFLHPGRYELAGRTLSCLDEASLVLHTCVHAVLGWRPPLLLPLRDVVQAMWRPGVDWDALDEMASSWRLRGVIGFAARTARTTLGTPVPEAATRFMDYVPGRREQAWLDAYTSESRDRGATALRTIGAVKGLSSKAFYLSSMVWPTKDFIAARRARPGGRTRVERLKAPLYWLKHKRSST
jgi:hypothetical protein